MLLNYFPVLGRGHTVALHSAALTLVLDQDQDRGPTLIPPAGPDPAPALAPMAGLIHAPPILDAMGAVTVVHGAGPVHGLMGIGALVHRGLPCPTGAEVGREGRDPDPTGLDHVLAPLVATGAAALLDENHLHGKWYRMK